MEFILLFENDPNVHSSHTVVEADCTNPDIGWQAQEYRHRKRQAGNQHTTQQYFTTFASKSPDHQHHVDIAVAIPHHTIMPVSGQHVQYL